MRKLSTLLGGVALASAVAACSADTGTPVDPTEPTNAGPGAADQPGGAGGITVNKDGVPVGPDGKPIPPKLDGSYELSNTFDLTSMGLLPKVVNETLKALSDFREKPSETLVDLLEAANVPVVSNVLNLIPEAIRGFVLGYIDDHLISALYQKVPVLQTVTGMLDDIASIVTKFELVTRLDLPEGDTVGDATSTHAVAGVAYNWNEQRHVIAAPELVENLTAQRVHTNAVLLDRVSPEIESGRLKIGDHTFSIPIGHFAVYALDVFAKDEFGKENLRQALGAVVDCHTVGQVVASRCISVGSAKVCVGHADDIEGMCSLGLDVLVGAIKGQIERLDIPLLHFTEGDAQMWDAPADGQPLDAIVSRIDKGYWTAAVNVFGEEHPVLATFTGRRL